MPSDALLDEQLRERAAASFDRSSRVVDVDAAWIEHLTRTSSRERHTSGRRTWVVAAAASIVVAGTVAIVWVAGRDTTTGPADEVTTTVPIMESSAVPTTVSTPLASATTPIEATLMLTPSSLPGPDLYPLPIGATADDVADRSVGATEAQVSVSNPSRVSALVGRPNGAGYDDLVRVSFSWQVQGPADPIYFGEPGTPLKVEGVTYPTFGEPGSDTVTALIDDEWNLTITARDPSAFLGGADVEQLIQDQQILDGEGSFTLNTAALPDGYEVIREPSIDLLPGSLVAQVWLAEPQSYASVASVDPLASAVAGSDIEPIEINGLDGWLADGLAVMQVSPTTYATVGQVETPTDVASVLDSFEFVGEATWRTQLGLDVPSFDATGGRPLTLDRGQEAGVVRGSLIFSGDELVGSVTDVGNDSSTGVRPDDPRFSVPVEIDGLPDVTCWIRGHNDHTGLSCTEPTTLDDVAGETILVRIGDEGLPIGMAGQVLNIGDSTHRLVEWLAAPTERAIGERVVVSPRG